MSYKLLAGAKRWFLRKASAYFEPSPTETHIKSLKDEIRRLYEYKLENTRLRHEVQGLRLSFETALRDIKGLETELRGLKATKECKGNG